jgi:phage replication initiation protein
MPKGMMGYRQQVARGNVRILFDGQQGMGVHVQASGKGCRELEAEKGVAGIPALVGWLLQQGGQFTRLDVAYDDLQGLINLQEVMRYITERRVVTRYRKWSKQESGDLTDDGQTGQTVYFGSAQSETRVRMYDKAVEQGQAGQWVRVELQTRDERAQALAHLITGGNMQQVAGVLRGLIEFKEAGSHSQRERWETAPWWEMFLQWASKVRLGASPAKRTIEQVKQWLTQQVAPSIALILMEAEGDFAPLFDLAQEGKQRLKPRHYAMVAAS